MSDYQDENGDARVTIGRAPQSREASHSVRTRSDDDGNTSRVQFNSDSGSIYDNSVSDGSGVHLGGLHSGGLSNDRNAESNRQWSGNPARLGTFEAKTQDGYRVNSASQLAPTDIVTVMVEGRPMEMEAQDAWNHGLLRRDGSGATRAATEAERAQERDQELQDQQRENEEAAKSKGEPMDAQSETWVKEALDNNQGAVLDVAVAVIDNIVADDTGADLATVPENVVQAFAEANKISPQDAQARIHHVAHGYQADAARMVEQSTGIPADVAAQALYESRNAPGLKELMMQHLHEGRADYAPIVQAWVASRAETAEGREAILKANPGGQVRLDGDVLLVRLPNGQEVDWQTAIYAKLMPFNRR